MLTKHLLLEAIAGTGSNLPVYVRFPGSPEEFPCRVSVEGLQGGVPRIVLTSEAPTPVAGDQGNFSLTGGTPVDGTEQANEPQKTVDHFATGDKAIGGTMVHTESVHDQLLAGADEASETKVEVTEVQKDSSDEKEAADEAENISGNETSTTSSAAGSTNGSLETGSSATDSEGNGSSRSDTEVTGTGTAQTGENSDSDNDGINDAEDPDDFSDLDSKTE